MDVKLGSLEIRRNLVDAGLGTGFILVAARRAGHPDGADDVVTDLDRQRALGRHHVGQKQGTGGAITLDAGGKLARTAGERCGP